MSVDIIRAWKDEDYRLSLTEEQRAALPVNPAGEIELADADLEEFAGGLSKGGGGQGGQQASQGGTSAGSAATSGTSGSAATSGGTTSGGTTTGGTTTRSGTSR